MSLDSHSATIDGRGSIGTAEDCRRRPADSRQRHSPPPAQPGWPAGAQTATHRNLRHRRLGCVTSAAATPPLGARINQSSLLPRPILRRHSDALEAARDRFDSPGIAPNAPESFVTLGATHQSLRSLGGMFASVRKSPWAISVRFVTSRSSPDLGCSANDCKRRKSRGESRRILEANVHLAMEVRTDGQQSTYPTFPRPLPTRGLLCLSVCLAV